MTFFTVFITLLLIMDPFGNIPNFLSQLKGLTPGRRRWVILRELVIALAVLSLFLFFGQAILSGLHMSESALQISGGVILFLIALKMIFPAEKPAPAAAEEVQNREPLVVPLAIPMVAGPSAMAFVILVSTQYPAQRLDWFFGLLSAWAVTVVVLLAADWLSKFLGERVLTALERLMGMILTTLSVQMLLQGIKVFMAS